jgi:mediator of replication checkpoint protein 1
VGELWSFEARALGAPRLRARYDDILYRVKNAPLRSSSLQLTPSQFNNPFSTLGQLIFAMAETPVMMAEGVEISPAPAPEPALPWSDDEDNSNASDENDEGGVQLTPRSKVKALLANLSDEEDLESMSPHGGKASKMQAQVSLNRIDKLDAPAKIPYTEDSNETNDDSDEAESEISVQSDLSDSDDSIFGRRVPYVKPRMGKGQYWRTQGLELEMEEEQPDPTNMTLAEILAADMSDHFESDMESEEELPDMNDKSRLNALVERKRQERQAQEAAEEAIRAEKRAQIASQKAAIISSEEEDSDTNAKVAENLSQKPRKTRKASKRALEEINRETQRMDRARQLTYASRTVKKVTTQSLFEKFNFKAQSVSVVAQKTSSDDGNSSASENLLVDDDTPPTSPPDAVSASKATLLAVDTPNLSTVVDSPSKAPLDKGKGKAKETNVTEVEQNMMKQKPLFTQKPIRVLHSKPITNDSDSDLEILQPLKAAPVQPKKQGRQSLRDRLMTFERSPDEQKAIQTGSLQKLALLAHLHSPSKARNKRGAPKTITRNQLDLSLLRQARQQAAAEREEKIEMLRAQGVHSPTAEERAKEEAEVEDLLAKARMDADGIMKREIEAEKKKAEREKGVFNPDEEEESADDEFELSGSEEEDEDEEEGDGGNGLIDEAAEESGDEHMAKIFSDESSADENDDIEEAILKPILSRRKAVVLSDGEDDEATTPAPKGLSVSVSESAQKTPIPGVPMFDAPPLGLTQIFAGTMAGSAAPPDFDASGSFAGPISTFPLGTPNFNVIKSSLPDTQERSKELFIETSLAENEALDIDPAMSPTQMSDGFDATQDIDVSVASPILQRFAEPEIDSPIVSKKGRLLRRDQIAGDDDEQDPDVVSSDEFIVSASAFDILKKSSKTASKRAKQQEEFDKKKSAARGMIEEDAVESEDEYAGLGGVSGSDSDDEDAEERAEEDAKMIDDADGNEADAQQLAALMADTERAKDEATVQQLYKDITTGALRRKRSQRNEFDLSDSEDDIVERRRLKRQEFEKMRRALLADEAVEKIANNPRKNAFMKTLEDREDRMDLDFLDEEEEVVASEPTASTEVESQDSGAATIPSTMPEEGTAPQQPIKPLAPISANRINRPGEKTNPRRIGPIATGADFSKPNSLQDIRKTLSFLIEDSQKQTVEVEVPSSPVQEAAAFAPRAASPRRSRAPIIDRVKQRAQLAAEQTARSAQSGFWGKPVHGAAGASSTSGPVQGNGPENEDLALETPSFLLLRRTSTMRSNSSFTSGVGSSTTSSGSGTSTPNPFGANSDIADSRASTMEGKSAKGTSRSAINFTVRAEGRKRKIEIEEKKRFKRQLDKVKSGMSIGGVVGGGFE